MSSLRGVLLLTNGGWIVDDTTRKLLVYRRELGAPTIRVQYDARDGDYTFRRIAEVAPDKVLTGEHALLAISEIVERLNKAGISAQVEEPPILIVRAASP